MTETIVVDSSEYRKELKVKQCHKNEQARIKAEQERAAAEREKAKALRAQANAMANHQVVQNTVVVQH